MKRLILIIALLFLLACGRAGEGEVVSAPTSTPTPQPVLLTEPTPTPTPTPDPYREMEKIFFPVLEELRRVPGNEGARVDWDSGVLARGKGFLAVQYPLRGVSQGIRIPLVLGKYEEEQLGPWVVRTISLPPEGRVKIGCTAGYPKTRRCEVVEEGGAYFLVDRENLDFFFIIEANGVIVVPRWMGPVPPGIPPELYERARPLP